MRVHGADGLRAMWAAAVVSGFGHFDGKLNELQWFKGGIYTVSCFFILTGLTTTGSFVRQWNSRKWGKRSLGWQTTEIFALVIDYVVRRCLPCIVLLYALNPICHLLHTVSRKSDRSSFKTPLFVGWHESWRSNGSEWLVMPHTWFVSVCIYLWLVTPICVAGVAAMTYIGNVIFRRIVLSVWSSTDVSSSVMAADLILRFLILACSISVERLVEREALRHEGPEWWQIYQSSHTRLPQYMMGVALAWLLMSPSCTVQPSSRNFSKSWTSKWSKHIAILRYGYPLLVDLFMVGAIFWTTNVMDLNGGRLLKIFQFDIWTIVTLGLFGFPACQGSLSVRLLENRFFSTVLSGGGTLLNIYVVQFLVGKIAHSMSMTPLTMLLLWLSSYFLSICLYDPCAKFIAKYLSLQNYVK